MEGYWFCKIGPVNQELLPEDGEDDFMREAIREAFNYKIGEPAKMCKCGWGAPEDDQVQQVLSVIAEMTRHLQEATKHLTVANAHHAKAYTLGEKILKASMCGLEEDE